MEVRTKSEPVKTIIFSHNPIMNVEKIVVSTSPIKSNIFLFPLYFYCSSISFILLPLDFFHSVRPLAFLPITTAAASEGLVNT